MRLHSPFDLRLEPIPLPPAPARGEVRIAVQAVGICGSDLHLYSIGQIGSSAISHPFVPGHEFMGTVSAVGPDAKAATGSPLKIGARVVVDPHAACGNCEWCEAGQPNLCPYHEFLGLPAKDGALCEQLNVLARQCYVIPPSISDNAAALVETLGVAIHAVDLAKLGVGRSVLVAGLGSVGLLILRLARLAGASTIIGVDPLPARTALARRWGATQVFTGEVEHLPSSMLEQAGPQGAHTVFEAAWAGTAVGACVRAAAPGGKVVLVGIPPDDACELTHSEARRKGLSLLFSRRMGPVMNRAIRLASGAKPAVALDELVTHEWPLRKAAQAYSQNARYAGGMIKSVIHPQR
jgi:L-iditol 2-dehydrogenase